jgi:hypothetical protein
MTDPCLPIGELVALAGQMTPDPRMAHVQTCPRCRSLLAAASAFASRDEGEACPGEGAAVPRIQALLQQQILGPESSAARLGRRLAASPNPAGAGGGGWIARFLHLTIAPRLLLPAAGVAAILVGSFLLIRDELPWSSGPAALREEPGVSSGLNLIPLPPRLLDGGGIELLWRHSAAAEAYRVLLFDAEMREIARRSTGAETLLVVPATEFHGSAVPVFWQVEALSQGDKIGDSVPMRWQVSRGR